jgi:hypothetical protein
MTTPDTIDPKVLAQLLTRREEDEGGRVATARAVARRETETGGAYYVIAAAVEVRLRSGRLAAFERVAVAFQAGPFVRLISIRPDAAPELANALHEAPAVAERLAESATYL